MAFLWAITCQANLKQKTPLTLPYSGFYWELYSHHATGGVNTDIKNWHFFAYKTEYPVNLEFSGECFPKK